VTLNGRTGWVPKQWGTHTRGFGRERSDGVCRELSDAHALPRPHALPHRHARRRLLLLQQQFLFIYRCDPQPPPLPVTAPSTTAAPEKLLPPPPPALPRLSILSLPDTLVYQVRAEARMYLSCAPPPPLPTCPSRSIPT